MGIVLFIRKVQKDAMTTPLHVVLGAGQVGSRLTKRLLAKGLRVRTVRRSGKDAQSGLHQQLSGDITDLAFAERAGAGATVVYDCMNPPYDQWKTQLLAMGKGGLHAAMSANARLVALDGLYQFGAPGVPFTEESPLAPRTAKGELKRRLQELRMVYRPHLTIGRASDFFGADLPNSWWGPRFFERITQGKPGETMGDPDMPHAYTYVDDVARALETLGENDIARGSDWMLPTAPAESTRALTQRIGRALVLANAQTRAIPRWLLKVIGLFNPTLREAAEMAYQWEVPFLVDDSRFVKTFGYGATPLDVAVEEVVRPMRLHAAPARYSRTAP